MIKYAKFQFASAPRTASNWFAHACQLTGLGNVNTRIRSTCDLHGYFPNDSNELKITIVRHPADWLRSFFRYVYPSRIGTRTDLLCEVGTFDRFNEFAIWVIKNHPGIVGEIFADYNADIILKTAGINSQFCELMEELGIPFDRERMMNLAPRMTGELLGNPCETWEPLLKLQFLDTEQDLMCRHGFSEPSVV